MSSRVATEQQYAGKVIYQALQALNYAKLQQANLAKNNVEYGDFFLKSSY